MIYRQGDIIFRKISKEEFEKKSRELTPNKISQKFVIARGETTGHSHRLVDFDEAIILQDRNGRYYLNLPQKARVIHEEHAPIELDDGYYEIWREQEYDYWERAGRKIID
jgi:hypothetical protein